MKSCPAHSELPRPLIVGVMTDFDVANLEPDNIGPTDMIELRIDMFSCTDPNHVVRVFHLARQRFERPIIATVRDVHEGGRVEIPDRLALYRAVAGLSDFMDVEIRASNLIHSVRGLITGSATNLIGSFHNFALTPDDRFLDGLVAEGKGMGADIVKVAVTANDREDLLRLLLFTLRHRGAGVVTTAMGEAGLASRVVSPLFGSLLTYGYITTTSAPGQLSVTELGDLLYRLRIR